MLVKEAFTISIRELILAMGSRRKGWGFLRSGQASFNSSRARSDTLVPKPQCNGSLGLKVEGPLGFRTRDVHAGGYEGTVQNKTCRGTGREREVRHHTRISPGRGLNVNARWAAVERKGSNLVRVRNPNL